MKLYESDLEEAAIEWFKELGYDYLHGREIAPDHPSNTERSDWGTPWIPSRMKAALGRINPNIPMDTLEHVLKRLTNPQNAALEEINYQFQQWLTNGFPVQVRRDGAMRGDLVWLVDFDNPDKNDWFISNQVTLHEYKYERRPDMMVYLNGMCIGVIELKNPEDENATLKGAWNQLQMYKREFGSLFHHNEILVISDGIQAQVGSLTAGFERFMPWRTIDGDSLAPTAAVQLEVLLKGVFEKHRLLDYIRNFVLWETNDTYIKKIAGYHQFHATRKAVIESVRASAHDGDGRIGVIWHTQGSGKSISMVFYTNKIMRQSELANPTIVVLTDRNDLDGQLFSTFSAASGLLPEPPQQAGSRSHLRELLERASGGIIFTTIQKWSLTEEERALNTPFPVLTERKNVIVVADEAHRSQYGFATKVNEDTGVVTYGLARNLRDGIPNACFIGFTGTPIEFEDRSTPAVFGDYIDTYTISQAVKDGATVPIHYEARLVKLTLADTEKNLLDEDFDEMTEGQEERTKHRLKNKWAKLEAMVGSEDRIDQVCDDLLSHWDRRKEVQLGKAMIVCMSRRICVALYNAIVKRRPDWGTDDDDTGKIKVIMTGSAADPVDFHPHIRNKPRLKTIEKRFKNPDDPIELVIVRDMWLTGFDAPCANTLYADKPMKGHGLMQAIARVNRVFRDKPSGLVVDYLGLAESLRKAVQHYGGKREDKPGIPIEQALDLLQEKFGIVRDMFHGFDYSGYFSTEKTKRIQALAGANNHILQDDDTKKRFLENMQALNKVYGIAMHLEGAAKLRDEVAFFQGVQKVIRKNTVTPGGGSKEDLNAAIRQLVSGAIHSDGVIDIFDAAGIAKPDLSILSDEFLKTLKANPYKNLQLELLRKLLNDEIRGLRQHNVVQSRKFSEMLTETLNRYQNRALETSEAIMELINMAQEIKAAGERGIALGLTSDELAFYDALCAHGNMENLMGDEKLSAIAHDLVKTIRNSVSIDWTQKESVRAKLRRRIKRLLREHGYPPDKRQNAVVTVIEQAEVICRDWAQVA